MSTTGIRLYDTMTIKKAQFYAPCKLRGFFKGANVVGRKPVDVSVKKVKISVGISKWIKDRAEELNIVYSPIVEKAILKEIRRIEKELNKDK